MTGKLNGGSNYKAMTYGGLYVSYAFFAYVEQFDSFNNFYLAYEGVEANYKIKLYFDSTYKFIFEITDETGAIIQYKSQNSFEIKKWVFFTLTSFKTKSDQKFLSFNLYFDTIL